MQKLEEFLKDVEKKNIFSYENYKKLSLDKKIEVIKLLNEYYKLKYEREIPKRIINIDHDGVIKDTIGFSKKMLMEQYGIDYDTHDRNNIEADRKVGEFFKNLDWVRVLNESSEINCAKAFISLIKDSNIYNPLLNSSTSSIKEEHNKEANFIEEYKGVDYTFCKANQPKKCFDEASVLVDDDDFNLRYWKGIPVRFISKKPTIFPTISDLGEIYYLFPRYDETLDETLPSAYNGYEKLMNSKVKRLEWVRKK